jgi:cytochrome oxidase Cu insertion factor (SCO1/SenC/PrrC family)
MARSTWAAGAVLLAVGCAALAPRHRAESAGEPAPPTEGRASDGRPLRLSDQRGRVVLLSFWHSS